MTNRRRAFEAIAAANDGFTAPEVIPEKALENLHHAGLLAPDLPEPTISVSNGAKAWLVKGEEDSYIAVTYIFDGEIMFHTSTGSVKGAPAKMRKISLALLAAANHAEGNQ